MDVHHSQRSPILTCTRTPQRLALMMLLCIVSFGLPRAAVADPTFALRGPSLATTSEWQIQIQKLERLLQSDKLRQAQKVSDELITTMSNQIIVDPNAITMLAKAVALRAVVASGLERHTDALWDWHLARVLLSGEEAIDLTGFGRSGLRLMQTVLEEDEMRRKVAYSGHGATAPKKLEAKPPFYPDALRQACEQGIVTVSVIIGKNGHVRSPTIVSGRHKPIMAFAALESLRGWRFEPARRDGEAVASQFNLTVRMRSESCPRGF